MSTTKPAITQEQWEAIGSKSFDTAEGLFTAYDSQSLIDCGERRWGKDYGKRGFMHSTDHRAALVKINGTEPSWLEVYDSWVAGDANPTRAFLLDPDDGSLSYCLTRYFNSMGRGMREWNSILSTGKLSNGKPVPAECASRAAKDGKPADPPAVDPPLPVSPPTPPPDPAPARIKLSPRSLETLKMLPFKGLMIGAGRASRLQLLREEIEAQL